MFEMKTASLFISDLMFYKKYFYIIKTNNPSFYHCYKPLQSVPY